MNNHTGSYSNYQQRYNAPTSPTVKNPSANFQKGQQFNDRDRLNDMLSTEKWLTDGYNVFVRETSHQDLYRDILGILTQTHHAARDLFNLMFEKGWYSLHPEQPSQIAKHHQKFESYQSQFPSQGQTQTQTQTHFGSTTYPLDY